MKQYAAHIILGILLWAVLVGWYIFLRFTL